MLTMNNKIQLINNQIAISSREIAKLTGKRYDNVAVICRELKDKAISPKIQEREYRTSRGNTYKEYLLNKRDSLVLHKTPTLTKQGA